MTALFGGKGFAFVIIGLSLLASSAYYFEGDVRHGTYWFAAAVLNITVTF